ncbi:MAG TPA: alkaline phosphatase family protein [Candidatus Hydrogenedentes bacterium]|jgi:predicted AlkP superfamily pyrophosphatase or phosphodiesterase|nr:MAG: phosphoglyceromutase [Candidatus Hydrogenedentes bacterium ADurb.Bin170]HOD94392.1 alkaline phosphatase family protein [Candidatus Hydrogenedentota bacterium]HOH42371.1 alkaline phosphatase family protein [Candidatus Hydrogenedentota bacterium]HOR49831.1 alkaline phosphatase family protein [Candidatus Hydrogenedentota bacterium]HPK23796.1 alkaline phosphatase family protein [Candidatus Hydrogenedentota bacterium]
MTHKKYTRIIFALLFTMIWTAAASAVPLASHVFIISYDGGAPYVMKDCDMPVLKGMLDQGACTWEAQTIFPSVTLIAHTSMMTGMGPAKHKVTWNGDEPDKKLEVTTCFAEARKKGLHTAFFPGKDKLLLIAIPDSMDHAECPGYESDKVAAAAAEYIVANKPNLTFVHFAETDGLGHKRGWGSDEQKAGFANADKALGVLKEAVEKAGIADDSVFIITADHGGHKNTHGSNKPEDMTIPWILWGKNVKPGHTISEDVTVYDTAATALWLLDVEIPESWDGKAITNAFNTPE